MKDALPCPLAAIDDQAVAGAVQLVLSGEPVGELDEPSHQRRMRLCDIGERGDVFRRDDEQVGWGLRIDVLNGEQLFSFSNDLRGEGSLRHATK